MTTCTSGTMKAVADGASRSTSTWAPAHATILPDGLRRQWTHTHDERSKTPAGASRSGGPQLLPRAAEQLPMDIANSGGARVSANRMTPPGRKPFLPRSVGELRAAVTQFGRVRD